jgi:hypothetical protein
VVSAQLIHTLMSASTRLGPDNPVFAEGCSPLVLEPSVWETVNKDGECADSQSSLRLMGQVWF